MSIAADVDIHSLLRRDAAEIDIRIREAIGRIGGAPPRLIEAMTWGLEGGGKRLRPVLALWSCEACGGARMAALPAALAVEAVHTFSLIHDDLPAIDNDDMRRGRPSVHAQFGEALAILAGDALLAWAFDLLTTCDGTPAIRLALAHELSAATGAGGLIGGEVSDLEGERVAPDRALIARIHAAKTARLIEAACRMGAIAAGADAGRQAILGRFGHELGLAFQATDDLLDITGSSAKMGKRTGKDTASGKQTYPRAVGVDESRAIARAAADRAVEALAGWGSDASRLVALARFVVERDA